MQPIVFIPALLCTETLYARPLAAFGDHPVMVADHRSHDTIAAMAKAILDQIDEPFSAVGLSMGGYVALELARQAPDRLSRLVLMDTNARADAPDQSANRRALIDLGRSEGGMHKVACQLFPGMVHPDHQTDTELHATFMEMALETGSEGFANQQTAIMNRADSRDLLPRIKCPALVVVGDGDALSPEPIAREMHQAIHESRLAVIPGAGHLSSLECPDQVTAVLKEFLVV